MASFVFITGATSGFGEATARIFAQNGFSLVLMARREERLEKLKAALSSENVAVETLCCDVRIEADVNKAVESLPENVKNNIRILVNNAGLAVGRGPIDKGLTDDWERMIDTNVKGLLYVSKAMIPFLKANGNAQIINIASIAGKEVYAGGNVYCATKHAVDALSQAMRIDLVEYGIKVTNIAPGAAATEFSIVRFKGDSKTADAVYEGYDPLLAQDIAETIWFVASRPAHVTINDLTIMPTAQAAATVLWKK
ncbi:MAG: SDR family NAD(P)-dependent oxidoreductase [Flavobacteriales bacterium]|nr:SDR family NAD(P)-dependent oxidoreductase [Crocinitomicaceae bacterium]NBX80045.1 SDR family NAD(P)-dependent oxidoreductase [Flavobacteriales bacterium]NCA21250.1 SDR family NAD(P)-dependent oxidoreductase [Crocinitomicaceae bacterium]